MEEKRWTKEDFVELATPRLRAAYLDPPSLLSELQAFFQEASPHYEAATIDGKAYVDQVTNGLTTILESGINKAPDTLEARKLKRGLSAVKGKHFAAQDLMAAFEVISGGEAKWKADALAVFTQTLQALLDILHDVTQKSQSGIAQFAQTGLFYWLIDELVAAQSLARRNHATLAYTHLRSCMEILDKVELFGEKPEFAKIWASGDEHQIWKKLAPARVREQLSREAFDPKKKSYDPLYEYFSQQGSHTTFTALKSRVKRKKNAEGTGVQISIIVGGISDEAREISILMYCIMLGNLSIMKAVAAFSERLNYDELIQTVIALTDRTFGFFRRYFKEIENSDINKQPLDQLYGAWEELQKSFHQDTTPSQCI